MTVLGRRPHRERCRRWVAVSLLLAHLLAGMLVGLNPHNPLVFAAAIAAFTTVALVATSVPAWRATRIDPVVVLTSRQVPLEGAHDVSAVIEEFDSRISQRIHE
jgi:hypothetical protein